MWNVGGRVTSISSHGMCSHDVSRFLVFKLSHFYLYKYLTAVVTLMFLVVLLAFAFIVANSGHRKEGSVAYSDSLGIRRESPVFYECP